MGGQMDPEAAASAAHNGPDAVFAAAPTILDGALSLDETLSLVDHAASLEAAALAGAPTATALFCCLYLHRARLLPAESPLGAFLRALLVSVRLANAVIEASDVHDESEFLEFRGAFDFLDDLSPRAAAEAALAAAAALDAHGDKADSDAPAAAALAQRLRVRAGYVLLLWSLSAAASTGLVSALPVVAPLAHSVAAAATAALAGPRPPAPHGFRSAPLPPLQAGHGPSVAVDATAIPRDPAAAAADAAEAAAAPAPAAVYPAAVAAALPTAVGPSPARGVFPHLCPALTEYGRACKPIAFPSPRAALRGLRDAAADIAALADALLAAVPLPVPAPGAAAVAALALLGLTPLAQSAAPPAPARLQQLSVAERVLTALRCFRARRPALLARAAAVRAMHSKSAFLGLGRYGTVVEQHVRSVCPSLTGWVETPSLRSQDASLPPAAAELAARLLAEFNGDPAAVGARAAANAANAKAVAAAAGKKGGKGAASAPALTLELQGADAILRAASETPAGAARAVVARCEPVLMGLLRACAEQDVRVQRAVLRPLLALGSTQNDADAVDAAIAAELAAAGLRPVAAPAGSLSPCPYKHGLFSWAAELATLALAENMTTMLALRLVRPQELLAVYWQLEHLGRFAATNAAHKARAPLQHNMVGAGPMTAPNTLAPPPAFNEDPAASGASGASAAAAEGGVLGAIAAAAAAATAAAAAPAPTAASAAPAAAAPKSAAGGKKGKKKANDDDDDFDFDDAPSASKTAASATAAGKTAAGGEQLSLATLACLPPLAATGGLRARRAAYYTAKQAEQHARATVPAAAAGGATAEALLLQVHAAAASLTKGLLLAALRVGVAVPQLPQAVEALPATCVALREPPLRKDDLWEVWYYCRFSSFLKVVYPSLPQLSALRDAIAAARKQEPKTLLAAVSASAKTVAAAVAEVLAAFPADGAGLWAEPARAAQSVAAVAKANAGGALLELLKLSKDPAAAAATAVEFDFSADPVFPLLRFVPAKPVKAAAAAAAAAKPE